MNNEALAKIAFLVAENQKLRAENQELRNELQLLRKEIQELREKLNTNSKNSSKPPSQDPHRGKSRSKPSGRRPGGRPGHRGHSRKIFSSSEKVRFYRMAKRSATECASIFDVCRRLQLIKEAQYTLGRELLIRVVAMLTKMAKGTT